jgi:TonB-linked SusC/RagA family outer membrane protein
MNLTASIVKKFLLIQSLVLVSGALFSQQADPAANQGDTTITAVKGVPVSGHITDASTGKPLPGINITIPEYSAALTDDKGNFSIRVPDYGSTLHISGPRFQYKQVALRGNNNVAVALHEDGFTSVFDPAFLPAGQVPLSSVPHAVVSLNANKTWERAAETPENYLQGQISGLQITRKSGTTGIGAEMFLRGYSSLFANNQPLIVVDGMIYDNSAFGNSLINLHVSNPLGGIDIKDIDNITVIKDGMSTYGTKGANGVINITTAHAKELATKIDFAVYGGINFAPRNIPLLDVSQYRYYLSDVLKSSGMAGDQLHNQPYITDDKSNPAYYKYHYNTDWQKKVLSNSGSQNYFLKVTGGDNIARYALSVGYLNNGGVISNTSFKRYSTRFNADLNLTKKLTASTNLSFTSIEQNLKDQGINFRTNPILMALVKSPFMAINEVSEQGIESPVLAGTDIFNTGNPAALTENAEEGNKNYRFFGSIMFNYQFTKTIGLRSLTGITYNKTRESLFIPRLGVSPDTLSSAVAYSALGSNVERFYSLYNDTYLSYKKLYAGGHDVNTSLGFRFFNNESEIDRAVGYNSPTDDFVSIGNGVSTLRQLSGDIGREKWLNTYLAINYAYKNKYSLALNVSANGSSRFGNQAVQGLKIGENAYAVLPSIAAGWLVSSEDFMSGASAVDLLKLRVSYGLTGNDDIGNYNTRKYYASQNLLGNQGLVRSGLPNAALQWETNKKFNAGLDLALFNERLSVSVDAYRNTTDNMITYEPLLTSSGFDYAITNNGGMRTSGIELSVNSRILKGNVTWDLGFNVARYRNEVTAITDGRQLTDYAGAIVLTETGKPASQFYGYKTSGVFSTNAEAAAANLSTRKSDGTLVPFSGGDVHFMDMNGDHVIDDQDRTVIGNAIPEYVGGISSSLSWKRLSLFALFTFSEGNDIYNQPRSILESVSATHNQTEKVINRWRYDGQVTDVPRASYGDPLGNARFSDRWIENGSYLRLRTLSLTYNVPLKSGVVKYANVYATANNLFTLTNYLGYDPEFSPSSSPFAQGIDVALEPQYKSVQLGVRFGL